jgi:hypothetical protein
MNEYDLQAKQFLETTDSKFKATYTVETVPPWDEKGQERDHYAVTLSNDKGKLSFDFWDSVHNTQQKRAKILKPYDALACLDTYVEADFDEFLAMYGYTFSTEREYLKLKTAHLTLVDQVRTLRKMYTDEELDQLNEIW